MRGLAIVFVAASVTSCGGPQVEVVRPTNLATLLPATLEAPRPKAGDGKTLHLRVYVDAAIRAQAHWKEDLGDQLDYASQMLTPLVGVKLAVAAEDWKTWDRTGTPEEALAALTALDKGDGVTYVVGFVAPPTAPTKVLAELGDAHPLGKQIIVRGWDDKLDNDRLAASLPELKEAERAEVIGAHKRHKQTVILLHQLAITLGAIASTDPTWLDHPAYSPKQSTFSERNRELMELALDQGFEAEPKVLAQKLLDAIEKSEYGGWLPSSQAEVVAVLKTVVEQGKAGKTAADIPAAAFDQWERIKTLRQQSPKDALIELDNLLAAYPANATMHQLKCDMLLDKPGVNDPITRAACTRVSELAPGDPGPHLAVGQALARTKNWKAAHDELAKAEPKIANLPSADDIAGTWKKLVGIYAAMGALTWTEAALGQATAANVKIDGWPEVAQTAQTRARYGVPRGAKFVAPDAEGTLVGAVRDALDLVYANKFGDAERAIAKAERTWPNAPGLAADRCDLAMRQNQIGAARAHCNRAIAAQPDESWALYLSGVIEMKDPSGTRAGIVKLKLAIAADPELGQAWRTLAKAYAREKDKAALDELGRAYQAKFNAPLPGA